MDPNSVINSFRNRFDDSAPPSLPLKVNVGRVDMTRIDSINFPGRVNVGADRESRKMAQNSPTLTLPKGWRNCQFRRFLGSVDTSVGAVAAGQAFLRSAEASIFEECRIFSFWGLYSPPPPIKKLRSKIAMCCLLGFDSALTLLLQHQKPIRHLINCGTNTHFPHAFLRQAKRWFFLLLPIYLSPALPTWAANLPTSPNWPRASGSGW